MTRNVRTYDHFCLMARTLELIGDRWCLLVVRDLLSGAKRFTDLMDRLGGITPKTLTARLRELTDAGLVTHEHQPGRREVWYSLTEGGADLAPSIDALSWWGLRHAWRPPHPGEHLHAEHLLRAVAQVIEHTADETEPARWHVHVTGDADYVIETEGDGWWVSCAAPTERPDVAVTVDKHTLMGFIRDPSAAADLGVTIAGRPAAVRRFKRLVGTFPRFISGAGH